MSLRTDLHQLVQRALLLEIILFLLLALACVPLALAQTGSLGGTKYNDLNANGQRDPGDPSLAGWQIELYQASNLIATATTDANGDYSFNGIAANVNYSIVEVFQSGWLQTAPASVRYLFDLANGEQVTDLDFGNVEEPCDEPASTNSLSAGRDDMFDTSDGAEPTMPGPDLLALLNSINKPLVLAFDQALTNALWGHTFVFDLPCLIIGARLTFRIRATGGFSNTDIISLREGADQAWGRH